MAGSAVSDAHACAARVAASAPRRCRGQTPSRGAPPARRPQRTVRLGATPSGADAGGQLGDPNWVQTALSQAIAEEDFAKAATLRDRLRVLVGDWEGPSDWFSLGVPRWLADRLQRLGFTWPTEVQRRTLPPAVTGLDCVLRASTGSGKTLAFLVPVLSNLDLVQRSVPQAIIVVPTRDLGVQHVMLAWRLLGGNISRRAPGDKANMFSYTGPRGVIVRGLFDAADVRRAATQGWLEGCTVVVGTPAALGRAIACGALPLVRVDHLVVDEADACLPSADQLARAAELLAGAPVTEAYVPTPDEEDGEEGQPYDGPNFLGAATPSPLAPPAGLAGDGADDASPGGPEAPPAAALQAVEALHLWAAPKTAPLRWHTFLVGATLDESYLAVARQAGLIPDPVQVAVTGPLAVPAGVAHRAFVLPDAPADGPPASRLALAALCRLIRSDLAGEGCGPDEPPARAWVFAPDEATARDAAEPLRAALWGRHTLAVLLPDGEEPTRAAVAFRDGGASLLLATPAAERGLDMPAVRFVYSMGPPSSANAYVHRAGRVGRVGALRGATVTTLCTPAQLPDMQAMARELGVELQVVDQAGEQGAAPEGLGEGGEDREATVQRLEDLLHLLS